MSQRPSSPLATVVAFFGSLKLAVVLLVLIGLLTWFGTLAQVKYGLFVVQKQYFESWFVFCELPISLWGWEPFHAADGGPFSLKIPLPGAYLVMILLFVNLIVGGVLRMKVSMRNIGVLVAHLGIAMLLVAGFVKLNYSDSGNLALYEQTGDPGRDGDRVTESDSYVSFNDFELALLRDAGDEIVERVVPESVLLRAREDGVVELPVAGLPFRVEVRHWFDNCEAQPKGPMFEVPVPVVDGVYLAEKKTDPKRERNTPGCYVTVVADSGERFEGIVMGEEIRPFSKYRFPFTFTVDGQRYGLDLRRVVRQLPFSLSLDEFRKTDHPGTMAAADYRSWVTVRSEGVEQKAQIFMNNPLRKQGYVLFQSSWGPQDSRTGPYYSSFEVSRNPSDRWPNIACWVIGIGMLIHFVIKLFRFLNSSTREALSS